jgi:hypothetical protein
MTNEEIKETLEKQLQLLSERSKVCDNEIALAKLSDTMFSIATYLLSESSAPSFEINS